MQATLKIYEKSEIKCTNGKLRKIKEFSAIRPFKTFEAKTDFSGIFINVLVADFTCGMKTVCRDFS